MTKTQKLITVPALSIIMLAGGALAGYTGIASADTATNTAPATSMQRPAQAPHVDGKITAISGSIITITADANHGGDTFTIDASGATFTKTGATATISNFAVGDKVWAMGTISGSSVTATSVTDKPAFGGRGGHGMKPGVRGTVSSVNGSTITLTGMDGKSYTVNAGSATVQRVVTGSLSDITVGDMIGVDGTVSGTNVTATSIMDGIPQMQKPAQQ